MDLDWDEFPEALADGTKPSAMKKTVSKKILQKVVLKKPARAMTKSLKKKPAKGVMKTPAKKQTILTGSCCSGLGTDEMALRALGLSTKPLFFCEQNATLRQHLKENFPERPAIVHESSDDLFTKYAPHVHMKALLHRRLILHLPPSPPPPPDPPRIFLLLLLLWLLLLLLHLLLLPLVSLFPPPGEISRAWA
eukprot:9479571-Pyramimonas_sp.AAC.1